MNQLILNYNKSVEEGDEIGKSGRTGNAKKIPVDQEHVHIYTKISEDGSYKKAKFTNPLEFFDTKFDKNGEPIIENAIFYK